MIRTDAHHHIRELARRPHAWLDGSGMDAIRQDFTLTDLALQTKTVGIDRTNHGPRAACRLDASRWSGWRDSWASDL
jgi:hypothetical protein